MLTFSFIEKCPASWGLRLPNHFRGGSPKNNSYLPMGGGGGVLGLFFDNLNTL